MFVLPMITLDRPTYVGSTKYVVLLDMTFTLKPRSVWPVAKKQIKLKCINSFVGTMQDIGQDVVVLNI